MTNVSVVRLLICVWSELLMEF